MMVSMIQVFYIDLIDSSSFKDPNNLLIDVRLIIATGLYRFISYPVYPER